MTPSILARLEEGGSLWRMTKRRPVSAVIGGVIGAAIGVFVLIYLPMKANYDCHGSLFLPAKFEVQRGPIPCASHSPKEDGRDG